QDRVGMGAGELEDALAFVFVGGSEVIADRCARAVADQQQPHAPVPLALGGAVAVGGVSGELAVRSAAGVVGASEQSAVDQTHVAGGHQFGDAELNGRDLRRQASQAAVE